MLQPYFLYKLKIPALCYLSTHVCGKKYGAGGGVILNFFQVHILEMISLPRSGKKNINTNECIFIDIFIYKTYLLTTHNLGLSSAKLRLTILYNIEATLA